jgi:hypothetical protein
MKVGVGFQALEAVIIVEQKQRIHDPEAHGYPQSHSPLD